MEEIDKLFQLYESDNVELMWQLAEGLGISKFDMIKLLLDKYCFDMNIDAYNNVVRFKYKSDSNIDMFYWVEKNDFVVWNSYAGSLTHFVFKQLESALEHILTLIENE